MIDQQMIDFRNRTNHGRSMVAVGPNHWLVLEMDGSTKSESLRLSDVQTNANGAPEYGPSICLAGPPGTGLTTVAGGITAGAVSIRSDGALHLAFSDEQGIFVWRSHPANLSDVKQLGQPHSW